MVDVSFELFPDSSREEVRIASSAEIDLHWMTRHRAPSGSLARQVADLLPAIDLARENGWTWVEIANALGVSRYTTLMNAVKAARARLEKRAVVREKLPPSGRADKPTSHGVTPVGRGASKFNLNSDV